MTWDSNFAERNGWCPEEGDRGEESAEMDLMSFGKIESQDFSLCGNGNCWKNYSLRNNFYLPWHVDVVTLIIIQK